MGLVLEASELTERGSPRLERFYWDDKLRGLAGVGSSADRVYGEGSSKA